jgi:hypothetical protein
MTESDLYVKDMTPSWLGYKGQRAVLIDDLDYQSESMAYHMHIWSTQGDPLLTYDRLIVTSNFTIDQAFKNTDPEVIKALNRRFKVIPMTPLGLPLS